MNLFSFEFITFFIVFLVIYNLLKKHVNLQNQFLLVGSYCFIMASSYKAIIVVIVISLTAFIFGRFLTYSTIIRNNEIQEKLNQESKETKKHKSKLLVTDLEVETLKTKKDYVPEWLIPIINKFNLLPKTTLIILILIVSSALIYFKYFEFIFFTFQDFIIALGVNPNYAIIVAPIGISYVTFNIVSYLVSAYQNELPENDITTACLLFSYFPTITAGPLIRAKTFMVQFNNTRSVGNVSKIITLVLLAILLKWSLASNLSEYLVTPIFNNPYQFNSFEVVVAIFGYSIQILSDFVAYIVLVQAIGLALGFKHPINFNNPYISTDLHQFWRRWNISVSTWIRDYIYIPLGGSRHGFWNTQIFLIIAMLFSALWHGANFNYIIWGSLHAFGLIVNNINRKMTSFRLKDKYPFIARLCTFLFVSFTWIYFATPTLDDANAVIYSIAHNFTVPLSTHSILIFVLMVIAFIYLKQVANIYRYYYIYLRSNIFKQIVITLILLIIFITLAPSGVPNFIYADF